MNNDKKLEKLWEELSDIPFKEENGYLILEEDWHIFSKGTEREEIWKWFDKNHSKGIEYLLYKHYKI